MASWRTKAPRHEGDVMSEPIPLFPIMPVSWDATDPWQFFSAYGEPFTTDLTERRWMFECDHDGDCQIVEGDPSASAKCGTPIGYRLVQEFLGQQ
jgi:hypothetical protein